jgi:hypothetical protein
MKKKLFLSFFLIFLLIGYVLTLKALDKSKPISLKEIKEVKRLVPIPLLKLGWAEFRGLGADYLSLKAVLYIGEEKQKLALKDWDYVYHLFLASQELDPYFQDPYWFVQAIFPWVVNEPKKAISFLEKGISYRDWDWFLPYYVGIDYFYFLRDHTNAAKYLFKAAKISNNPHLATLAANISQRARQTEITIFFLNDLYESYKRTNQEEAAKIIAKRLKAIKGVLVLEKAIKKYKTLFGKLPPNLEELVEKDIIKKLPKNPYGIPYYLKDGEIKFQ